MHIFATLGRADPELFRRWLGFGGALLSGRLPGRLRELVILRTAYRFDGRYEWAHHIEMGEAAGRHRWPSWTALGGDLDPRCEWTPVRTGRTAGGRRDGGRRRGVRRHLGRAGGPAGRERADRAAHADRPLHDADDRAAFAAGPARAPGARRWPARAGRPGGVGGGHRDPPPAGPVHHRGRRRHPAVARPRRPGRQRPRHRGARGPGGRVRRLRRPRRGGGRGDLAPDHRGGREGGHRGRRRHHRGGLPPRACPTSRAWRPTGSCSTWARGSAWVSPGPRPTSGTGRSRSTCGPTSCWCAAPS